MIIIAALKVATICHVERTRTDKGGFLLVRVQNWLKHSIVDAAELVSLMFLQTKYRHISFPNVMLSAVKPVSQVRIQCLSLANSNWHCNALQSPSIYFAVRNKERHSRAAYRECRPCGGCRGMRHPGESVTKQRNVSFRSLQSDCNGDFVRQHPTCLVGACERRCTFGRYFFTFTPPNT